MPTDTLSTREVAARLGVGVARVRQLCESGRLTYRLNRYGWREIDRAAVEAYAAARDARRRTSAPAA